MADFPFVNYYQLLEINPAANPDQIRDAIKSQRRIWIKRQQAPNVQRQREAEDRVRMIDSAEKTLLDPTSRTAFDQKLANYVPTQASQQEPGSGVSWLQRAQEFLDRGDGQSAAYAARQATDQQPSYHEAWAVRARADFLIGRFQDSIFEFNEALRIRPEVDDYHFDLGTVYESMENFPQALACYNQASKLAPNQPMYQVAIAGIFLAQGFPHRALSILESVHNAHPDVEAFSYYFAVALNESTIENWTPVGIGHAVTEEAQIQPSRQKLQQALNVRYSSDDLRAAIRANLALVDWAEAKHFRLPGFTAAKKTTIRTARSGTSGGCLGPVMSVGCTGYILIGAFIAVLGVLARTSPILAVVMVIAAGVGLWYLAWRPGWKWNQIDARGVNVTKTKSIGTHAPPSS